MRVLTYRSPSDTLSVGQANGLTLTSKRSNMNILESALDYLGSLTRYSWTREGGVSTITTSAGSWASEEALDAIAYAIAEEIALREAIAVAQEEEIKS